MSRALVRPLPRPHAALTLLCMSFCGGGTASFRSWARSLPDDVELVLHCYPGREGRFTSPFARDWDELLADAVSALRGIAGRPYTLLGHSMGAWVAFDLAVRADRAGLAPPQSLIVSAADAPTRWKEDRDAPPTVRDSDEDLLDWMSANGQLSDGARADPEIMQIAVEILRADMQVMDTYRYRAGERARVPLHFLHGEEDHLDGPAATERWRQLGTAGFTSTRLPGGHFYTPEVWARLPGHVSSLRPARHEDAAAPVTA